MVDSECSSKLEIFISGSNLPKMDVMTESDPMLPLSNESYFGCSYAAAYVCFVRDQPNPEFVKRFEVDYYFEESQILLCEVYDIDDSNAVWDLSRQDYIGHVLVPLSEVAQDGSLRVSLQRGRPAKNAAISSPPLGHGRRSAASITFKSEQVDSSMGVFRMNLSATDVLLNQGFLCCCRRAKVFLEIYRLREDNSWQACHRTAVIYGPDPNYGQVQISSQALCNGDFDRPLRIVCFHDRWLTHPLMIGQCETSANDLLADKAVSLDLEHPRTNARCGCLHIDQTTFQKQYSFLEYIRGGTQIQMMVAVDFTASNGDPASYSSLHHRPNRFTKLFTGQNPYQQALQAIGRVVLPYDSDQMVPAFGFGARVLGGPVSHCFALNCNEQDPEVHGLDGILEAYEQACDSVVLSGPTLFSQVIERGMSMASRPFSSSADVNYTILLIITDGIISDMNKTVQSIVKASSMPLSIIIVGVGSADFSRMHILDADDVPLQWNGKRMERDIVQFVEFSKFKNASLARLAKETLAEVPDQLVSFMTKERLAPRQLPR